MRPLADRGCFGWLRHIAAAHLPFHQFRKGAIGTRAELLVRALFSHCPIRTEDDDCIRTFDGRESMSNTNSRIVAAEKSCKGTVHQRL